MEKKFTRDTETWFIYFSQALLGFVVYILGPITPYLREELNTNYTIAGFHFSALAVGMLLAGFFSERLQKRWGFSGAIWIGAIGMAFGTILFVSIRSIYATLPGTFFMGLFGINILSTANTFLTHKYKEQSSIAITEVNMVASIMAVCAPFLVGLLAPTVLGWRAAIGMSVVGTVVLIIFYHRKPLGQYENPEEDEFSATSEGKRLPLAYWLYWLLAFLGVALEFCFVYWGTDFLWSVVGLSRQTAVFSMTVFLFAVLFGRWLGSRVLRRVSEGQVLSLSLVSATFGFILFWTMITPWLSILGLFLYGLGTSNIYPSTISNALRSVPHEMTSQASARAVISSGSATLLLPLLLGFLADLFGMEKAFLIIPVLLFIAFLTLWLVHNKKKVNP